jgi:hypothetical protein
MPLPHEVLGVSADADVASIKRVFRALAKEWHPDRSPHPNANAHFREILSAYVTLIHRRSQRVHVPRVANVRNAPFAAPVAASVSFGDDLAWEDPSPQTMRAIYPRQIARYVVAGTIGTVAVFWISAFLSHI